MTRRVLGAVAIALLMMVLTPVVAAGDAPGEPDCAGPAGDPQPGTVAWDEREQDNAWCGEQRFRDTSSNPAYAAAKAQADAREGTELPEDPFRDPPLWQGKRFRYEKVSFKSPSGQDLPGYLFRPCDGSCRDMPAGLQRFQPPYPGVVIVHGGGANQEMYWWGAEGLAEAGYMVLTFQIPEPDNEQSSFHYPDSKAALDWFLSPANPRLGELDRAHVGLAGHSAGGVAVTRLGQEDPRVSAIVSWDRAQSSPMPAGLRMRTPALFLAADYLCQRVPVCVPQPFTSPPDPLGPGNKDEDYRRVSGAGVDSMKVTLRAATHLDFTQLSPGTGSRYGAAVSFYYTLAWFDRYLRGSSAALARLTGTRFDASGDIHNISGGAFDPATGKNLPAFIAGQPVADRLSFEYRSAYFLDHGRYSCANIRAGCPAAAAPRRGRRLARHHRRTRHRHHRVRR
ncbi:MAG: alpha/beta hydrolase family protein [Thermoleophilaceae bacterium]